MLKISYPNVQYQHNDQPSASSSHVIRAWFDSSSPYLSRASPLLLAYVSEMTEDDAKSLGIKKIILFLLNMLKDDAGTTSSDPLYVESLRTLHNLEIEIERQLRKM